MHEDANSNQHPLLSTWPTTCHDEYRNHRHRPEEDAVGDESWRLPRGPHDQSDWRVYQVWENRPESEIAKVHCFVTERVSNKRNGGPNMPEQHASTNQDRPTVDTPWRILLLYSDDFGG